MSALGGKSALERAALDVAMGALAAITDPKETSLRYRDKGCARYVASDALDRLERLFDLPVPAHVRWTREERDQARS